MAITEKITLIDGYSAKADKIASSSMGMGRAMEAVSGVAYKMGSALKSAFDRKHTIKINYIVFEYAKKKANELEKTLKKFDGKSYSLDISYKEGRVEKLKKNLASIGKGFTSIGKGFTSIGKTFTGAFSRAKFNLKGFFEAKKQAKELEKMLSLMTGKKHKVKIDLDKPDSGGFLGKLKSGFSKLNPFSFFKGGGGGAFEQESGSPSLLKSIVGGNLIAGAISKGIGAVGNVAQSTLGAGFNRLTSIESAQARLRGFGYSQKEVKSISNSATQAVTGTQYSMSDAMTASASAIAAGIKTSELEGYLKEVGNAAAATGADFTDIASIMNKVKTTGRLQADEMNQLSDRGLPMLTTLAEQAGVSSDEMAKMISRGEVSFDQFRSAVKAASGTAAEETAKTWEGAKDNFKAALSKLGAGILGGNEGKEGEEGGIFGLMTPALLKVNDVLNSLVPKFKDAGDSIKDFVTNGFEKAKGIFNQFGEAFAPIKEKLKTAFEGIKEAFTPVVEAIKGMFDGSGDGVGSFIDIVAGALNTLADIIIAATPVIQTIAEIIASYVIPVIREIVSFVTGSLIPTIISVVDSITGFLTPVIEGIVDLLSGPVTAAFEGIKGVVETLIGVFDSLCGAVESAASFLAGLPSAIGGWVSNKVSGIVGKLTGKNATGTSYFPGGLTRINERGEELIQLARGSKIYPSQKTDRIIKNEVSNDNNTNTTSNIDAPITINVYGDNKEEDIAKAISKEFKRLGVLI